jgi:hypothetical protein
MLTQEIGEKSQLALAFAFWSAIIRHLGLVAQSVEQRIENPCVGGSIPPRATKNSAVHTKTPTFGLAFLRLSSHPAFTLRIALPRQRQGLLRLLIQ